MQGLPKGIRALENGAFQVRVKGRDGDVRRQVATLEAAQALLADLRAARGPRTRRPKLAPAPEPAPASGRAALSIGAALEAFIAEGAALNKRADTADFYDRTVRRLARELGGLDAPLASVTRADLDAFVQRRAPTVSPATLAGELRAWRALRKWAGLPHAVPTVRLDAKRPERLSLEDRRRVLAAADQDRRAWLRGLIWTCALAGVRRTEASKLRACDVDLQSATLTVPEHAAKGRRARVLPIRAELVERLRPLAERGGDGPLFPAVELYGDMRGLTEPVAAIYRRAGVRLPRKPLHVFRSTLASELLAAGWSFEETADYLGWARSSRYLVAQFYLAANEQAVRDKLARIAL